MEDNMTKKITMAALSFLILAGILCVASTPAWAECRDDCYSSCCGGDTLCQGSDAMSCLVDCLKACGGQGVPDVPEPKSSQGQVQKDTADGQETVRATSEEKPSPAEKS